MYDFTINTRNNWIVSVSPCIEEETPRLLLFALTATARKRLASDVVLKLGEGEAKSVAYIVKKNLDGTKTIAYFQPWEEQYSDAEWRQITILASEYPAFRARQVAADTAISPSEDPRAELFSGPQWDGYLTRLKALLVSPEPEISLPTSADTENDLLKVIFPFGANATPGVPEYYEYKVSVRNGFSRQGETVLSGRVTVSLPPDIDSVESPEEETPAGIEVCVFSASEQQQ